MKLSNIKNKFNITSEETLEKKVSKFLTISTSRRKLLINGIFTAIMMGLVLCNITAFFQEGVPNGALLYVLCLILILISGAINAFKWGFSPRLGRFINKLTILISPLITITMVECLNGVFIFKWPINAFILNCLFYSLLFLALYALSGSERAPFLILNPILFALSLTNHYVYAFRGTVFLPMDFLAAGTAANVADAYDFSFNYQIVIAIVLLVFAQVLATKIKTSPKKLIKKVITRGMAGFIAFGILISYYTSDFLADAGLKPDFFNQERGYQTQGFALNFWLNTKYLTIEKPDGYDAENIEEIVSKVLKNFENPNQSSNTNKKPNIICIMNETLTDLSVLGNIKTNQEYMPFLNELTENTIKGNLYVPVIGAGTSNTEFEFLTGASTAFLPSGSNAYTLYVKKPINTLTSTLKGQGYSARAFHPYFESNWNRVNVYNYMSFDKYNGMESLFSEKIIDGYKNGSTYENLKKMIAEEFPNEENLLMRTVVSDSYNYKKVIEMYEERDTEQPFYIFNVTMQNHGGYDTSYPDFEEKIHLIDENGNKKTEYPKTNQFLSLIYESDRAFEELINYFENQDEPTIICMFGDHQPSIEDEFIAETLGADSIYDLNLKQTQDRYVTPFYIWTNYDIEEKKVDKLSVNYLSSYLMNVAELEMPKFNQYLLKLSETIPVIDTVGYIDSKNKYYIYSQETPYTELIRGYENICYNYLFDEKEKCDWLFELTE